MFKKAMIAGLAAAGLAVAGVAAPAAAGPAPDVQIVYEYSTPTEPPVPGTFAVVNYTENDYWFCLKWTSGGQAQQSPPFFLDEYAEPGHERTGLINVDAGTTITLFASDGTKCSKKKIDTFRVPA